MIELLEIIDKSKSYTQITKLLKDQDQGTDIESPILGHVDHKKLRYNHFLKAPQRKLLCHNHG